MLWNSIYDFFVQFIFGGIDSGGNYHSAVFGFNQDEDQLTTANIKINLPFFDSTEGYDYTSISIGDYLSLLATIISITIILVLCCLFIWKIIKLIGGLIR